jgi:GNAT superfamily N-acetyltransferase
MTERLTIRTAVLDDIAAMQRVRGSVRENRLSNPATVQARHYEQMLRSGRGWVCELDGTIVGFAIADLLTASVWALFVDPACERRGIGRQLHAAMVAWLFASGIPRITLTTEPGTRAERFYRAAGWTVVGEAPNGELCLALDRSSAGAG